MHGLDPKYVEVLDELAQKIQASEELAKYLEEEEEDDYIRLKELFEPQIADLHKEVASLYPLQLVPFEEVLLQEAFEGLYLPRILGFSVLRGEVSAQLKYVRPQNHFKATLLSICNSANFDILRKRIGQSIQMGFALSSDIWITNLINEVTNKRVRYFLQGQKLEKYRRDNLREIGYNRFKRQFRNDNFYTAKFPMNLSELKIFFSPLKNFLLYRIRTEANNESLIEPLKEFVSNKDFHGTAEHMQILAIFGFFFDLNEKDQLLVSQNLELIRQADPEFSEKFLSFVLELHKSENVTLDVAADQRFSYLLEKEPADDLSSYFRLIDKIHEGGYEDESVKEAIRVFYNQHKGLSVINECVRETIFGYFDRAITPLGLGEYPRLFEISRQFPAYMEIFSNQQFNQNIKDICMVYIRKLLKHYTDKRGKDYQDIKKFVSATFLELNFLKDKEIVELFKTRRKRKKAE